MVELRFLQTQLKAYLELRFYKRSLKKRSYTARFFVVLIDYNLDLAIASGNSRKRKDER